MAGTILIAMLLGMSPLLMIVALLYTLEYLYNRNTPMTDNTETLTHDSNTVTLDKPIKRGDQVITAVTVVPPSSSGALRGTRITELMQLHVDSLAILLPRITTPTLTQQDVYNLDPSDFVALAVKVTDFLLPSSMAADVGYPTA